MHHCSTLLTEKFAESLTMCSQPYSFLEAIQMKKLLVLLIALSFVGLAGSALAAKFEFHGDLNNRFMVYTNQAQWFSTLDGAKEDLTSDDGSDDSWGEIKYRLWAEAATDDDRIKGVYAIEIGAVRFGRSGSGKSQGGGFSGDGVNIETRWAYTDFAIPHTQGRVKIGLLPVGVNGYFWNETAMGVFYKQGGLNLGWARGSENVTTDEQDWGDGDLDALIARYDHKMDNLKLGFFGTYLTQSADNDTAGNLDSILDYEIKKFPTEDFDMIALGIDGGISIPTGFGNAFVDWDAIYENGSLDNVSIDGGPTEDYDISAYLLHVDAGVNIGRVRLSLTSYYASGDDDDADSDLEGFLAVDVDRFESIIFQEGGYTDDSYFTERPYIGNKGLFLNKLSLDYKATEKMTVGAAILYLLTAEDLEYVDDNANAQAEDSLGTELDAYVSYQLFENCEVALNMGYLFADDAMDFFEVERDGSADNDIFRSTARVRYKF